MSEAVEKLKADLLKSVATLQANGRQKEQDLANIQRELLRLDGAVAALDVLLKPAPEEIAEHELEDYCNREPGEDND